MGDGERETFMILVNHFAAKLDEERRKSADLKRRLDAANERLSVLEGIAYGAL